jgi:hypothetical protein
MVKYPLFKLMRLEKSHLHGYFNNIHFILCSVKKKPFHNIFLHDPSYPYENLSY